ncbi:MAG: transposase [Dehalococcoidia bacterium]|nr:transposase [Dehalococcoidia bacterium]
MTFDHPNLVADSGPAAPRTVGETSGSPGLVARWVHTGAPNPRRQSDDDRDGHALQGDQHRRTGPAPVRCHPPRPRYHPLAPSTIGTFLRTFTFGHVRQLDKVISALLANAWVAGAGPKPGERLIVDLDSTVAQVYGKLKQGASYGYTKVLGYHPLFATRAGTGEILGSRMRKGAAGSSRGVLRFIGELLATIGRAGVSGPVTVRADSAFWGWKLVDKLTKAGVHWSITVRLVPKIKATIAAIPETDWTTIFVSARGHAHLSSGAEIHHGGHLRLPPRASGSRLYSCAHGVVGRRRRWHELGLWSRRRRRGRLRLHRSGAGHSVHRLHRDRWGGRAGRVSRQ